MGLLDRWTKKKQQETLQGKSRAAQKADKKTESKKIEVKEEKATVKKEAQPVKVGGVAYRILARPLVTEKAAVMESQNKYTLAVAKNATKDSVRAAVLELYGVSPLKVQMINVEGKAVRFGRGYGRRSDYKKAIVTLPAGKTIALHEGV